MLDGLFKPAELGPGFVAVTCQLSSDRVSRELRRVDVVFDTETSCCPFQVVSS